ncbi:MAG TPA: DegT/DnrJ/EryC1/StrS family aminotransferase [Candidatus Acidoferrum sp.]|nr:DegT/DnrJ/EryC1/StrS family aminotransferase [Candidatus Acidoferrum sp.]
MRIPLSAPDVQEEEIAAVAAVLRTPRLSLGPKLEEFEQNIARYVGSAHAIAVSSGTAGLHLCVRGLEIGARDEVIVPSFTFVAVANAVRYENAVPVFADVEAENLNLDPGRIEAAITSRTKAILLAHTFGCPADLAEILEIARRHDLYVIEDACEAIGAEYDERKVGTCGDAGVFAFYPNKQITTGEGGAVVTADPQVAARVRALRNQGRADSDEWFQHAEVGYNYRISEMNCALGIGQMKRIEAILARREEIASKYNDNLRAPGNFRLPALTVPRRKISWFVYVVRLADRFSQMQRDWIANEMNRRGIGCGRYFAPIHLQLAYRDVFTNGGDLRVTEFEAARCLALPFFNRLEDAQIAEVCGNLVELTEMAEKLLPASEAVPGSW